MSCRILVIRHGESEGNLLGVFLGHTDLDLTERGRAQAELVGEHLKSIPFDKIYSSDLIRAHHTALPLSEKTGIPVITRKDLREIFAGEWEMKPYDKLAEPHEGAFEIWMRDLGRARCPGGESVAELYDRVAKAITEIARENDGKTVAVFTHATPIKVFFTYAAGKPLEKVNDFAWVANASVSEALYENGAFEVILYGDADFLGDWKTTLGDNV